jgi:hypothetical protein
MTKKVAILLAALALVGCAKDPEQRLQTNNSEFELAKLFTHEGCSVYRFSDAGHYRYWADCRGRISSDYTESCGKNCTRTEHHELESVE